MVKKPKPGIAQYERRGFVMLAAWLALVGLSVGCLEGVARLQHEKAARKAAAAAVVNLDEPLHPPAHRPEVSSTPVISLLPTPPQPPAPDYTILPIQDGIAPVISTLPTKQNVVFLGIDDGANKEPFELQMMKDNHIKASLFLADAFISHNPEFFKDFIPAGSLVEDHTVDHVWLSKLSFDDQKKEICAEADNQERQFGRRPILFRPPGGYYNLDTQKAAAACGMKAVVMWIAKANGGSMQYQIGDHLRPGDIVLMHFRPEFKDDMNAFLAAQNAAGLHTELLEDWLAK